MGIFLLQPPPIRFLLGKFRPGWKKVQFLGRLFAELSFDPRLNRSFDSSDSVGDISNVQGARTKVRQLLRWHMTVKTIIF